MSAQTRLQDIESGPYALYTADEIERFVEQLKNDVTKAVKFARLCHSTATLGDKLNRAMKRFLTNVSADNEQKKRAQIDLDGIVDDLLDDINYDPMPALADIIDDATAWQIREIEEG